MMSSNQPIINPPALGDADTLIEQFLSILVGIATRLTTESSLNQREDGVQSAATKKAA